jgi:hypothetical protein
VDAQITGDLALTWKAAPSLRVAIGAERTSLFENGATLENGLVGLGPLARLRWQPTADLSVALGARHLALTDDNTRDHTRADVSQRLWGRTNEVRLVASTEHLSYTETRDTYFTPGRFWRHDAGLEWRGWLATPQFYGDRERWISAAYLVGADDRREQYHTVADGFVVRSRVYDGARVSFGLRLKHVPTPVR